jgi:hypothetical protein
MAPRIALLLVPVALLILPGCTSDHTATEPTTGTPSLARSAAKVDQAKGATQAGKVTLCHRTGQGFKRITVGSAAVPAHLAHGDELANETSACAPTVATLSAVADGSVRTGSLGSFVLDNSVVQVLNVPSFEDRGVVEFDTRNLSLPVQQAQLKLSVFASNGPFPFTVQVFAYSGNGVLDFNDRDSGTLVTSFAYAGETTVTLDVTSAVRDLVSGGAPFVGFNFRIPVVSPIDLNGPFVAFNSMEYPPAAVLEVTEQPSH